MSCFPFPSLHFILSHPVTYLHCLYLPVPHTLTLLSSDSCSSTYHLLFLISSSCVLPEPTMPYMSNSGWLCGGQLDNSWAGAAAELLRGAGSSLEQSPCSVWCLQGHSLGFPPPGPHRKGYADVQSCPETAVSITAKAELSVTLIVSLWQNSHLELNQIDSPLSVFRRKVTLSVSCYF